MVRDAQAGNRQAYGELATKFEPTVYAICLSRLGNVAEAQELTQDVFLHAMTRLDQLREPERFAGWIRQVAANLAINRATRRAHPTSLDHEILEGFAESSDNPLDRMIDRERAARLWSGLAKLREMDRRTLLAFYVEGNSLLEIAKRHDAPLGTVKRRLHTARKRLRLELESELPDADEWVDDPIAELDDARTLESVA